MRFAGFLISTFLFLVVQTPVFCQDRAPSAPPSKSAGDSDAKKDAEAALELQKAIGTAGNDRAALVRNLKDYVQRFPDAPRRVAVYRALVESCGQLRDNDCSLEYAERLIAIEPNDYEMMMLAVDMLKQQGNDASLTRAGGYVSRVLDHIQKSTPDERPPRVSLPEWQENHETVLAALYFQLGQIENSQHNYDAGVKDLQMSFSIRANASAAEALGELAELRQDPPKAIEEYSLAFALPEAGPAGKVDRREIRRKLGNVWRQVHGSEQGLAEQMLSSYDHLAAPPAIENPAMPNKGAKNTFDFVLRRIDGSPLPLAPFKGKILVLSFWATWCGPCRELEPVLGQVEKSYQGNSNLAFFAANTDEDQTLMAPFLARVKWDVTAVYADGLDEFLKVATLPTVLILDREGKIVYRISGYSPVGFPESLNAAIQAALGSPK